MPTGLLLKGQKGLYTLFDGEKEIQCRAGSRLRKSDMRLSPGDNVDFTVNDDGTGFITEILPRKNAFVRPPVANIDVFVIVTAAASPDPDIYYLDSLCAIATLAGAEVVLVINKTDIKSPKFLTDIYEKTPIKVFCVQAVNGVGVDALREELKGKTAVFAGPSGAGKSSLLNALCPSLSAETGELSERLMRGKNTTRVSQLFLLEGDIRLADTPGFTMLDFTACGVTDHKKVIDAFPEMLPFTCDCRWRDCAHTVEEGCAVLHQVEQGTIPKSRHESFVRIYTELKQKTTY